MSGGERTDHGEPIRPRVTSAVSPWLFLRRMTARTERKRTSAKLLNAAPLCATLNGYFRGGIFPLRRTGDQARRNSWATLLFQRSPFCFRPARVDQSSGTKPIATNQFGRASRRQCRLGYFSGKSRPDTREENELARSFRTHHRFGESCRIPLRGMSPLRRSGD